MHPTEVDSTWDRINCNPIPTGRVGTGPSYTPGQEICSVCMRVASYPGPTAPGYEASARGSLELVSITAKNSVSLALGI